MIGVTVATKNGAHLRRTTKVRGPRILIDPCSALFEKWQKHPRLRHVAGGAPCRIIMRNGELMEGESMPYLAPPPVGGPVQPWDMRIIGWGGVA